MPSTGAVLEKAWVKGFKDTHDKLRGIDRGTSLSLCPFGKGELTRKRIKQLYDK